jgi:hypothetical protein
MPIYPIGGGLPKDISKFPDAIKERVKIVADEAARLALTITDVQNGDTVIETDTKRKFTVIDDTKLDSEDGYVVTQIAWNDVESKPSSFTPSEHTHSQYEEAANKKTSITDSDVDFPTGKAVLTALSGKEGTLTKGNLTEATSSVLTISGGTGSVIGSGTTLQVAKADTETDGYLDKEDWNVFDASALALPEGTVALFDENTYDSVNGIQATGTEANAKLGLPDLDGAIIQRNKSGLVYYGYNPAQIVGVKWDSSSSRPVLTRVDRGVGRTAGSLFNDVYPFSEMKRVALAIESEVPVVKGVHLPTDTDKWLDDTTVDWSAYETAGWDCMVQIPRFYYRKEIQGTDVFFLISNYKFAGFKVFPAFTYLGSEKEFTYFSAFEGWLDSGGRLRSLPSYTSNNKQPTTAWNGSATDPNRHFTWFKERCQAGGLKMMNVTHVGLYQWLYAIEYANFNSQTELSTGITNLAAGSGNCSQNTGYTKEFGNYTGEKSISAGNGVSGTTYPFSYRGIENPYGNTWKWVDGIVKKPSGTDGYTINGVANNMDTIGTANGTYYSQIHNEEALDFLFMPSPVNPSSGGTDTYFTDAVWSVTTNDRVPLFGGFWLDGLLAGSFCWDLYNAASHAYRYVGARVAF